MSIFLEIGKIIPHDEDTKEIKRITEDPFEERTIVDYYFDKTELKFYNTISTYMKAIKQLDRRKYRRIKRHFNRFKKSIENVNPNVDYSTSVCCVQMNDLSNKFKYKKKCTFFLCFSKKSMLDFLNRYKYYYHDKRDKITYYEVFYGEPGCFVLPFYRDRDFLKTYQQLESIEWKPGYFFICSY